MRAASLRIALLAGAVFVQVDAARAEEPLGRWMMVLDGGLTRPQGRIRDAFGPGASVHWSLAREVRPHLDLSAAVFAGGMRYALAQEVPGATCIPAGQGRFTCAPGQARVSGVVDGAALGLVVPLRAGRRIVQFGGGGLRARYSTSPESSGARRAGGGYYAAVGSDLVAIERRVGAGVLLRVTRLWTRGDAFGTALPLRTVETWLDFDLLFRVGGPSRGRHAAR